MEWKYLSKVEAAKIFESWQETSADVTPHFNCTASYELMRHEIAKVWYDNSDLSGKARSSEYDRDLCVALCIYKIMTEKRITLRIAANDDFWRYLSLFVVPDIVFKRWGLNEVRFYKGSTRLWLKTLYWYIYLTWQGDLEQTEKFLSKNTTDDIVQIVERIGLAGYRVDLTRAIMKQYYYIVEEKGKIPNLLRRAMRLNTALIKTIEPNLVLGGAEQYANDLFSSFGYSAKRITGNH